MSYNERYLNVCLYPGCRAQVVNNESYCAPHLAEFEAWERQNPGGQVCLFCRRPGGPHNELLPYTTSSGLSALAHIHCAKGGPGPARPSDSIPRHRPRTALEKLEAKASPRDYDDPRSPLYAPQSYNPGVPPDGMWDCRYYASGSPSPACQRRAYGTAPGVPPRGWTTSGALSSPAQRWKGLECPSCVMYYDPMYARFLKGRVNPSVAIPRNAVVTRTTTIRSVRAPKKKNPHRKSRVHALAGERGGCEVGYCGTKKSKGHRMTRYSQFVNCQHCKNKIARMTKKGRRR